MKRRFINQEGEANKFWEIEIFENSFEVTYGKVGTKGRQQIKDFATNELCEKEVLKLIKSKLNKGYVELAKGDQIPEKKEWEYRPMDEDVFWEVIGLFNWKRKGDDDAVMRPAFNRLVSMTVDDIKMFAEILSKKLYDLDGMVYAQNIGEYSFKGDDDFFSLDYFLYVRCCVVANGKEVYYNILENPKEMPKDLDFEALIYLAEHAYNKKLKTEDEEIDTKYSYETFSNEAAWI